MRPYDGIDYRYTSADADREKAIGIVENLLGFRPENDGLEYALNFYSGGIGVDDRLAIRCRVAPSDWPAVVAKLRLKSFSEALADPGWAEDLRWLIRGDCPGEEIRHDCDQFINSNRRDFQDIADPQSEVFFTHESDVNAWCVVWRTGGYLNHLSFDQG